MPEEWEYEIIVPLATKWDLMWKLNNPFKYRIQNLNFLYTEVIGEVYRKKHKNIRMDSGQG